MDLFYHGERAALCRRRENTSGFCWRNRKYIHKAEKLRAPRCACTCLCCFVESQCAFKALVRRNRTKFVSKTGSVNFFGYTLYNWIWICVNVNCFAFSCTAVWFVCVMASFKGFKAVSNISWVNIETRTMKWDAIYFIWSPLTTQYPLFDACKQFHHNQFITVMGLWANKICHTTVHK